MFWSLFVANQTETDEIRKGHPPLNSFQMLNYFWKFDWRRCRSIVQVQQHQMPRLHCLTHSIDNKSSFGFLGSNFLIIPRGLEIFSVGNKQKND